MYLKLSKILENISYKLRQKALYFELKHYITNKQFYLKLFVNHDRNIGKTYTLLQLAHKYKCPIAVPNYHSEKYLKQQYKKMFKGDLQVIVVNESSKGKREELILCEEGIIIEHIYEILSPMSKVLVGYKSHSY